MGWGLRSWRRRAAAKRGFLADRRGTTASEFGLLLLPFSLLIFATIESCISFAAQEVMANATHDVSRLILTGKVRKVTVSELKTMLCDRMSVMAPSTCTQDIVVNLATYQTFALASQARFKVVNGVLDVQDSVSTGDAGTKSLLRVFYPWPVLSNYAAKWMPTALNDGKMLHFASEVWQNEPFPD